VTRRNEYSPLSRIKSTNYLDSILARDEAQRHGADDALLLNTAGHIAEATAANLFIVTQGQMLTPPLSDGPLEGTMREEVISAAAVRERSLSVADVTGADEVFLSNSLGLQPVIEIAGIPIGSGTPGPAYRALMPLLCQTGNPI
jgi:branched-chain amino acid aminotransferase